jgi:hypothetical protein
MISESSPYSCVESGKGNDLRPGGFDLRVDTDESTQSVSFLLDPKELLLMSLPARMTWRATLLSITVGITVIGCADSPGPAGDRVQLFDDGGVSVAELKGLWASDWPGLPGVSVDTVVGPLAGDDLGLVAPLHAAVLSDGKLVMADVGTRRVWIRSGAGEWREGPGPGGGPGEFRAIGGVWAKDGGFIVHDPQAGDLIHFDEEGRFIERQPVGHLGARHGPGVRAGPWAPTVQPLGPEHWLVSVAGPPESVGSGSVMQAHYRFTVVSGPPSDGELEIGSGPTRLVYVEGGGGAPVPFAPSALAAGAAGRIAMFGGGEPKVEVLDQAGTVISRVQWTDVPRPLDATHRGALGDYMRAVAPQGVPAAALDPMIASLNDAMPYPETLPHLGDLRLGLDGTIWLGWPERSGLEMPTDPELVREWRVIAPGVRGQEPRVYRVVLPEGTTLLGPKGAPGDPASPEGSGPVGEGAFFLLLRDPMGRQGLGVLRYRANAP